MLIDCTVTHLDSDFSEVRVGDSVATVQRADNERAIDRMAARLVADGKAHSEAAHTARRAFDAWTYTTPRGETFSHPMKTGALAMARRYFWENGIILAPFDHAHLSVEDRGNAHAVIDKRDTFEGPRVGDFVLTGQEAAPTKRICGIAGEAGDVFALSFGGSFWLPRNVPQCSPTWSSYSGSLDWNPEYKTDSLFLTPLTARGLFSKASSDPKKGGAAVQVAAPCRVYALPGVRW